MSNASGKTITVTEQESKLLDLVRDLQFGRIVIVKESGKIVQVVQEKSIKV